MIILTDKDMVVLFGLVLFWLGGTAFAGIGSIETIGYDLEKGYEYICSECGMLVPVHHYHGLKECKNYHKPIPQPNHKLYVGAEKYVKAPDWHSTLEEQRQPERI